MTRPCTHYCPVVLAGLAGCSGAAGQAGGAAQNAGNQAADAAQKAGGQAAGAAQNVLDQAPGALGERIQAVPRAHPVTFTSQSADLSSEDSQTLQQIAAAMKASNAPVTVVTQAGYPNAAQAQQLSQQRADNIAKALTDAGADASRIKAEPGNTAAQGDEALRTQISSP
jgi:peptidoglycan-associated lipoprotein